MGEELNKQRLKRAERYFKYGSVKNDWGNLPHPNGDMQHWILEKLYEKTITDVYSLIHFVKINEYTARNAISTLESKKLITVKENKAELTEYGKIICEAIYKYGEKKSPPTEFYDRDYVRYTVDKDTKEITEYPNRYYDYKIG